MFPEEEALFSFVGLRPYMALDERSTRGLDFDEADEVPPLPAFSALAMDEMGVVMVAEVLGVVGRIG